MKRLIYLIWILNIISKFNKKELLAKNEDE